MAISTETLLNAVTTTGAGAARALRMDGKRTFQALGATTAGAGAAAVLVQVSNDGSNWITIGTITLTLATTESSDGFASDAKWRYVRGNVQSISGTGAYVTLIAGH